MVRNLLLLVLVTLLGGGGFVAWRYSTEQQRRFAEQEREILARQQAIERLSRTRRVAQAVVKDQWTDANGGVHSRIRFVELGENGEAVSQRTIEVEGKEVYFDALVLKFDEALVAAGDPLKGRSVLLFRRVFGEHQKPVDGVPLDPDAKDGVPDVYRARGKTSDAAVAEAALWREFWRYADDPKAAKAAGVRVAQGEAPFTRMEKGRIYEFTLDDDGGLNIAVSSVPAVLQDEN